MARCRIRRPGTSPPYPVNGSLVSCFFTPSTEVPFTHPPELGDQIRSWMPDFMMDVPNFRSDEKQRILDNPLQLCDQRFTLAEKLIDQDQPDFSHAGGYGGRSHPSRLLETDGPAPSPVRARLPFVNAIHDYYVHVDQRIGELLKPVTTTLPCWWSQITVPNP
jgi:predicted AlkP superfamily phosphohydrolase/phosphomutase